MLYVRTSTFYTGVNNKFHKHPKQFSVISWNMLKHHLLWWLNCRMLDENGDLPDKSQTIRNDLKVTGGLTHFYFYFSLAIQFDQYISIAMNPPTSF